jgi:hypothetical protein
LRGDGRRDQQAGAIYINQVGARQQIRNRGRLARNIRRELRNICGGLPAAMIRTALNFIDAHSAGAEQIDQRSAGWNRRARRPAPLLQRGEKIEQASLRAAQRAELIEK